MDKVYIVMAHVPKRRSWVMSVWDTKEGALEERNELRVHNPRVRYYVNASQLRTEGE